MMHQNLLLEAFLDEIRELAHKSYKGHLHQAFVAWYIEAEFGSNVDWKFTDDVDDGGIDAIVWRPEDNPRVILIQSKFSKHVGKAQVSTIAYDEFKRVVDTFRYRDDRLEALLSNVRDDLRPLYKKASDRLEEVSTNWAHKKKAFRLVTTCKRKAVCEFAQIPAGSYVYADDILRLYAHYLKGTSLKARDLKLHVHDKLEYKDVNRHTTSYLFNARVVDFSKYLDSNDVARLISRNIRFNLGKKIGRDIRKTYEKDPANFWYVHNGLTIVCDKFVLNGWVATLVNPSVINGAQTLYAINGSQQKNPRALVTTRVVVRGAEDIQDEVWLQRVIRGVNTQNRVGADDFRSNEPEQIELQKRFRDLRVFYEKKRGEWREVRNEPRYKGFDKVSLTEIGQILTVISVEDGQGVLVAKRGIDGIFEERHYRKLFRLGSGGGRQAFQRIYFAYRLYRFLKRYGYRGPVERRKQGHAFWNTLWLINRGMTSMKSFHARTSLQSIRDGFDMFEARGMGGVRARKILRQARTAVWIAWRKGKKEDPEKWTANNFFKAKFGNQKVLLLALPKVRKELAELGRQVLRKPQ